MSDIFLAMLDHVTDAYSKGDAVWAMNIPQEDEEIDKITAEMQGLLETRRGTKEEIAKVISTVNLMRNLERAGDHAKNICEDVIYQIKGQQIDFG